MRRKYGNKTDYVGDEKFDSIKEARYFLYLTELERSGEISALRRQVPFTLLPKITGTRRIQLKTKVKEEEYTIQDEVRYIADFVYIDRKTGEQKIVDVKSAATKKDKVYVLKKKMMRALLGLTITEVIL